jgi:hypothetical protein
VETEDKTKFVKSESTKENSRPHDEIPHDILDVLLNLESTFELSKHCQYPDDFSALHNVLYASKRFCYLADWLNMSHFKYFEVWSNFYKYINLSLYKEHYSALENDEKYFYGWFSRRYFHSNAVHEFSLVDSDFTNFVLSSVSTHASLIKHRTIGDRYKHIYQ